jgi:hypothetical protein
MAEERERKEEGREEAEIWSLDRHLLQSGFADEAADKAPKKPV